MSSNFPSRYSTYCYSFAAVLRLDLTPFYRKYIQKNSRANYYLNVKEVGNAKRVHKSVEHATKMRLKCKSRKENTTILKYIGLPMFNSTNATFYTDRQNSRTNSVPRQFCYQGEFVSSSSSVNSTFIEYSMKMKTFLNVKKEMKCFLGINPDKSKYHDLHSSSSPELHFEVSSSFLIQLRARRSEK